MGETTLEKCSEWWWCEWLVCKYVQEKGKRKENGRQIRGYDWSTKKFLLHRKNM